MENLLDAIRAAIAPEAAPEARAAGVDACRRILTALGATAVEPAAAPVAPPPLPIADIVSALRGLPAEQLLDVAIARVRSLLPADVKVAPTQPIKFVHVPIPGGKP